MARGELDGDGHDESIVAPGPGVESIVKVFSSNGAVIAQVEAYPNFKGGVYVAAGDVELQHLADRGRVTGVQGPGLAGRAPLSRLQPGHGSQLVLLGQAGGQGGADAGLEVRGADAVVG